MIEMVIFGAGGFGREVAWLIEEINREEEKYKLLGFIDDDISLVGKDVNSYPVLGGMDYLQSHPGLGMVVSLGDPVARLKAINRIKKYQLIYPNLIHPSVLIGNNVSIGIGNVICAGSIITVNIRIGNFCHLNLKTSVGHDCILGDLTTTACSVDFAGYSHTKAGVYFGNQSTLLPSTSVGEFSIIGAGAVVNRNIPDGVVAVGVPAKVIKRNRIYEEIKETDIESLAPDPGEGRAFH